MNRTLYLGVALILAAWPVLLAGGCSRDSAEPAGRTNKTEDPVREANARPIVVIETSMGAIQAELWADKAPKTAANFLQYVDDGFYDGLIFHRVIDGFMIQGGGFTPQMQQEPPRPPIENEASAQLLNDAGTLAMARTTDVHSATCQFFINLKDNDFLNHRDTTPQGFGYCAFGKVTEGFDVVGAIGKVATASRGDYKDVPVQTVEIKSIRRAE